MYVHSALAVRRERKNREKLAKKGLLPTQPLAKITHDQLKPPEPKSSLTYFNVGVEFTYTITKM